MLVLVVPVSANRSNVIEIDDYRYLYIIKKITYNNAILICISNFVIFL